ncbi:proton-coupled folate transporter [Spodoptera frugiperda]|uniref:Proton-coupled folate transporter n=1 Tax=Spodoptera frugiperda TaxID=7108 RepID=A0A9R0CZP6_SPOFR|nr:proton-coupled folate transporter [Spodoptera frugiperda]
MITSTENISCVHEFTRSNILLTGFQKQATWKEQPKKIIKYAKNILRETTVEPCLFIYMLCTAISSLAVMNMHLDKACRVNFDYGDDICDRIAKRNTTGLDKEEKEIQSLVSAVVAWKFPLQTAIPAAMVLFVGAWSDKYKKRKICILFPFIGEIICNIGLLFATYFFKELSLTATALIEALPAAFTGGYIIIFMGMFSFMADRTTIENRTFRLGLVTICVTAGTPTGTALSGILLRAMGYYGVFSLLLVLYTISFVYGLFRLEDVVLPDEEKSFNDVEKSKQRNLLKEVFELVGNTVMVAVRPRALGGRAQIFCVLLLYLLMVGPLYGDSQVAYLYVIRKFGFTEVEYSVYGTINIVLGIFGTLFCVYILSQRLNVQDSAIGALAATSRIASCFMFAFAPTRPWYYSAPILNIFSHTGLTAIRSIASKSVPTEEVAKLNALIGVTEAIAPSIYMPSTSYIYVQTISSFPGAFYMFDAVLTVVALGLFSVIYILVRRRMRMTVTDPQKKEEFARTNEVSRF